MTGRFGGGRFAGRFTEPGADGSRITSRTTANRDTPSPGLPYISADFGSIESTQYIPLLFQGV